MFLINKGKLPVYCALTGATIRPGGQSYELTLFSDFLEKFKKDVSGFEVVLSDKDLRLLLELCKKHIFPKLDDESIRQASGADSLRGDLVDPGGLKALEERARQRRIQLQKARSAALQAGREREARIRSESNDLDESGNPIPKVDMSATRALGKVEPKLHETPGNDLKSVIENNLAVMRTASGQPIRNREPKPNGAD